MTAWQALAAGLAVTLAADLLSRDRGVMKDDDSLRCTTRSAALGTTTSATHSSAKGITSSISIGAAKDSSYSRHTFCGLTNSRNDSFGPQPFPCLYYNRHTF